MRKLKDSPLIQEKLTINEIRDLGITINSLCSLLCYAPYEDLKRETRCVEAIHSYEPINSLASKEQLAIALQFMPDSVLGMMVCSYMKPEQNHQLFSKWNKDEINELEKQLGQFVRKKIPKIFVKYALKEKGIRKSHINKKDVSRLWGNTSTNSIFS